MKDKRPCSTEVLSMYVPYKFATRNVQQFQFRCASSKTRGDVVKTRRDLEAEEIINLFSHSVGTRGHVLRDIDLSLAESFVSLFFVTTSDRFP